MTDNELRRLLDDAVPDLPAPPDRLTAVGARVRRTRRRAAAGSGIAAVVAVALAIGVPTLVAGSNAAAPGPATLTPTGSPSPDQAGPPPSPPPLDAAGCPAVAAPPPTREDRPGPLVRTGAIQVTLCERLADPMAPTLQYTRSGQPRALTVGVDQVAAYLNELPTEETVLARLREEARQRGQDPTRTEILCFLIGSASQFSLALRYPDGTTTVVWLDRNCATARTDGRTRYGKVLDLFLKLYRDQLVATTRPADIPTPACPPTLRPEDSIGGPTVPSRPLADEIARNRSEEEVFLPSPLAKATVCRYVRGADGETARLTKTSALGVSERLRDLLNTATTPQATTIPPGGAALTNGTDCAQGENIGRVRALDLVRVADATAAVADVAVVRTPCGAVVRWGMGGLVPTADLLSLLDANLGPVS